MSNTMHISTGGASKHEIIPKFVGPYRQISSQQKLKTRTSAEFSFVTNRTNTSKTAGKIQAGCTMLARIPGTRVWNYVMKKGEERLDMRSL